MGILSDAVIEPQIWLIVEVETRQEENPAYRYNDKSKSEAMRRCADLNEVCMGATTFVVAPAYGPEEDL